MEFDVGDEEPLPKDVKTEFFKTKPNNGLGVFSRNRVDIYGYNSQHNSPRNPMTNPSSAFNT